MSERQLVAAQLAGDIHTLIEKRSAHSSFEAEHEWLTDPNQSYFAYWHSLSESLSFLVWDKNQKQSSSIGIDIPDMGRDRLYAIANNKYNLETRWYELVKALGHGMSNQNANDQAYASINVRAIHTLQNSLASPAAKNIVEHWQSASLLAYIATLSKPETHNQADLPRKHRNETADERIFRLATTALDRYRRTKPSSQQREGMDLIRRNNGSDTSIRSVLALLPEHGPAVEDAHAMLAMHRFSGQLLDRILSTRVDSRKVQTEYRSWEMYANHLAETSLNEGLPVIEATPTSGEPRITFIETRQPMLGPDVGSRPDQTSSNLLSVPLNERTSNERMTEQELLDWLSRMAMIWSSTNEATIACIDLERSGSFDYMAAILSQTLPDGTVIEHAVAKTRSADDATFVFRAENGISDDGEVWLDWKNVFGSTKDSAQLLGARRMLHTPTLDERIIEYLTRKPSEINRPGYRM